MIPIRRRRGQPLVVLGAMLGCWIAVRVVTWQSPFPLNPPSVAPLVAAQAVGHRLAATGTASKPLADRFSAAPAGPIPNPRSFVRPVTVDLLTRRALPPPPVVVSPPAPPPLRLAPSLAAGHQLLWMAAVGQMPLPARLVATAASPASRDAVPPSPAVLPFRSPERRWSGDGWLLLRRGGSVGVPGAAFATYGASQAGAVLRYRIDPASGHRPTAYVRGTAALNGSGERELAGGLSLRPLAGVPVTASAELRATRLAGGAVRLRPAAALVTEIAPVALPAQTRAEFYAQAGYVGGAAATAFVDGQLRLDRRIAGVGRSELRAGGGVWGGAQKGAARLDAGPSATLGFPAGAGAARLGFDWRFRIAGNAVPASGPALTLSAGF